tara:strand:+ start:445 stop:609 length:165 start_codon:yes stop_codon:yes gene_type:complete
VNRWWKAAGADSKAKLSAEVYSDGLCRATGIIALIMQIATLRKIGNFKLHRKNG